MEKEFNLNKEREKMIEETRREDWEMERAKKEVYEEEYGKRNTA